MLETDTTLATLAPIIKSGGVIPERCVRPKSVVKEDYAYDVRAGAEYDGDDTLTFTAVRRCRPLVVLCFAACRACRSNVA